MKYDAIAIRGGTAGMDSLSTKDTVLPHDTVRKRTEPYTRLSTSCRRFDETSSIW